MDDNVQWEDGEEPTPRSYRDDFDLALKSLGQQPPEPKDDDG